MILRGSKAALKADSSLKIFALALLEQNIFVKLALFS
jgi:hypothetical protein